MSSREPEGRPPRAGRLGDGFNITLPFRRRFGGTRTVSLDQARQILHKRRRRQPVDQEEQEEGRGEEKRAKNHCSRAEENEAPNVDGDGPRRGHAEGGVGDAEEGVAADSSKQREEAVPALGGAEVVHAEAHEPRGGGESIAEDAAEAELLAGRDGRPTPAGSHAAGPVADADGKLQGRPEFGEEFASAEDAGQSIPKPGRSTPTLSEEESAGERPPNEGSSDDGGAEVREDVANDVAVAEQPVGGQSAGSPGPGDGDSCALAAGGAPPSRKDDGEQQVVEFDTSLDDDGSVEQSIVAEKSDVGSDEMVEDGDAADMAVDAGELEDFDLATEPMCRECNVWCVLASSCICCDDASTTTSTYMSLCTEGGDEQNQPITCCGHIGCPDPTSPFSDLTECDACQNWHCEDYCEEECTVDGCHARLCRSCMDEGNGLCLGCRLFCDICQDFCCFRGDQLVQCSECSKLVCSNCLDEDDSDGNDAPVCTECCEDAAAPAALGLIERLGKQYPGITFNSNSKGYCGYWGQQTGTSAGCGRCSLGTTLYGTPIVAALALSANQYALGLSSGSIYGDTLGVQPVLDVSVDEFEAQWKSERTQLRALPNYSAKAKEKTDMKKGSTLNDVVQMVIDDLNRKLKRSWPHDAVALRETLDCLKDIIAGGSRSFCWNDLPAPRPHDSVLNVDEDSFPVYFQALVYFFCQWKDGGWIRPERFTRKADYSDERNTKLFRDCADHGTNAVFEMCLVDPRYRADFLLLLAEHPGDPRQLPVEQRKKVVHRFLKSIGVFPESHTPIFCKQRDDLHDGNATEEECKCMVAKLGLAFHAEMERINKELEDAKRQDAVLKEHVEEGRPITRLLLPAFQFINKYQIRGKPAISLDEFAKGFMQRVHVVPELRRLRLEDMTDMTVPVWNNSDPRLSDKEKQRFNKLAELKQDLLWYANGGKCFYHGCERHIGDYPPSARNALHLHHPDGKSTEPKTLAGSPDLSLPNEHLDPEKGLANACPFHHDHGERRKYELSPLAHVRKLRSEPSRRDQYRSTEEIFADRVMALKFVCYIIESHIRGTASVAFPCDAMTNRLVMDAYFSRPGARGYSNVVLWDDMSRPTAGQYNNGDGSCRFYEFQRVLMNVLTFEGYCCVSANEKASREAEAKSEEELTEDDFACKPGDYDFRNLAPTEYYAVHGDHIDRKKKNYKPSELACKNLFDLLDESLVFRNTVSFSHSIKTRQENRGVELCYHHTLY